MRAITVTVGPLAAASANNIALSQSVVGASAVVLNGSTASGGVATLDTARRVLITSAGNDSGITFTITGTNWSGSSISEVLTGGNIAAVPSVLDYATVTSIKTSGSTASTITVGTNGVAASPWARMDEYMWPDVSIQCNVTGTVIYTVQSTLDDPNDASNAVAAASVVWVNTTDTLAVNATTSLQTNFGFTPRWFRVLLNSGTGSVRSVVYQAGSLHS